MYHGLLSLISKSMFSLLQTNMLILPYYIGGTHVIEWGSNVGVAHTACIEFRLTYRQIEWDRSMIQAAILDILHNSLFNTYDWYLRFLSWAECKFFVLC